MWLLMLLILLELIILATLSSFVTRLSFTVLVLLCKSRSIAITILTILFFPGTVIHELSHLFTAEILGVRTGTLTLAPESIEGDDIQSGSVQIAKTDPFRRTLIGIAPIILGMLSISALSYWLSTSIIHIQSLPYHLLTILLLYLITTITTTMFSSKEDLLGVVPVVITLGIFALAFSFSGIRIVIPLGVSHLFHTLLQTLSQYLGVVVGIQLVALLVLTFLSILFTPKTYRHD